MARRLVEATGSWADRVASTVVAGGAAERPVAVPRGQRHSPPRVRLRRRIVESLSVVHLVVDEPQEYGHTKGRVKHSFWRHGLSEWFFVRGPVGLYETVAEFTAIFHREGVQNACGAHYLELDAVRVFGLGLGIGVEVAGRMVRSAPSRSSLDYFF